MAPGLPMGGIAHLAGQTRTPCPGQEKYAFPRIIKLP